MSTNAVQEKNEQTEARPEPTRSRPVYRPNVDIVERSDALLIYADMPGVNPDDVAINFQHGSLTIHGQIKPRQAEETRYLVNEYGVGDFYRDFRVGEAVDASQITAQYNDGVLIVHLPKVEAVKPRTIKVASN
jgi:HSP20 family protein